MTGRSQRPSDFPGRSERPSARAGGADDAPGDADPADPLDPAGTGGRSARGSSHDERPSLDKILPELLRRGIEAGRGPLGKVGESFLPRELAQTLVSQLGDARSGIVKAVAVEVGRFLREADIASEMRKVLVGLDVEAQVRFRFKQRADGTLEPEFQVGSLDVDGAERAARRKRAGGRERQERDAGAGGHAAASRDESGEPEEPRDPR